MLLNVEQALDNAGQVYSASLSEWPAFWENPLDYEFASPIRVEAEYVYDGNACTISGRIVAELIVQCGLCLKDLAYSTEINFDAVFSEEPDEENGEYGFSGEKILLDKMVLDEISLNLPVRFLCKQDCRGLCPVCGQDLNEGQCGCDGREKKVSDNPFDKLKGLFD